MYDIIKNVLEYDSSIWDFKLCFFTDKILESVTFTNVKKRR